MRDLHQISAKRQSVDSVEEALRIVREDYPTATKQGSMASWSFWNGEELVGEAWAKLRRGWWLRVKPKEII